MLETACDAARHRDPSGTTLCTVTLIVRATGWNMKRWVRDLPQTPERHRLPKSGAKTARSSTADWVNYTGRASPSTATDSSTICSLP